VAAQPIGCCLQIKMTMRLTLFFMLALVLFVACKKDALNPEPPPITNDPPIIELGKSSMLKDGQLWNIPLKATVYQPFNGVQTLRIGGRRYLSNGLVEESFSIRDVFPQKGKYFFTCSCNLQAIAIDGIPEVSVGWVVDKDQVAGSMAADTTKLGDYVEIIRYDAAQQTVEGRFQAHIKNKYSVPLPWNLPNEVFISEGKFNLKIE